MSASAAIADLPSRVNGAQAQQLVANGALLLDVRTPSEFASSRIDGAKNIPLQRLQGQLSTFDPGRPVVVYCRSGNRSHSAAQMLRSQGIPVTDLGAMSAWDGRVGLGSLVLPLLASLTLGLAPFTPEPHIVGKLRWVAGGAVGMGAMDWFDLVMHGAPWVWLVVAVVRLVSSRAR